MSRLILSPSGPAGFEVENPDKLLAEIKAALKSGKSVKFTYPGGIVKIVTEWNIDESGDLEASYSEGQSKFVCPTASSLKIEYITPE